MKKLIFTSVITMAMLGNTVSLAESPLVEKFTSLSEQIIEQSARPFDKLEELKALFTSCAESDTSEVGSACTEWLASSYPRIKEATPQQIYVELGSGDVEVKFIKSDHYSYYYYGEGENVDIYQLNIPKYNFSYQFHLVKNRAKQPPLSEWKRSQNGYIAIPDPWYGNSPLSMTRPTDIIGIYATPQLSGDSSLQEVGKEYKKVYQDVFQFNNWELYYEGFLRNFDSMPDSENFASFSKEAQKLVNERFDYLMHGGDLPKFFNQDNQHTPFTGNMDALYGWHMANSTEYCERHFGIKSKRKSKPGCREILKKKYSIIGGVPLYVAWNKNNPKYIWVVSHNTTSPSGKFIVK